MLSLKNELNTFVPVPQFVEQLPQDDHCDNTQLTGQQLCTQSLFSEVAGQAGAQYG